MADSDILKAKCGFLVKPKGPNDRTAGARLATHQRFCAKCDPDKSAANRREVAERLTRARGQEPRARGAPRVEAPATAPAPAPAPARPFDPAAMRQAVEAARGSSPPPPIPPPAPAAPATPQAPAPSPAQPGGMPAVAPQAPPPPPKRTAVDAGFNFDPSDFMQIADAIHGAESDIFEGFTKVPGTAMRPAMRSGANTLLSKLLRIVWETLDLPLATKVLITLYVALQMAYVATVVKEVRAFKTDEEARKHAAEERAGREGA